MSILDLRNATRIYFGGAEAQALYRGADLLWQAEPEYPTAPATTLGYVADGDSLTHGYGVTPTYPQHLEAQTNLPVMNLGVSGRRLREMDETFESRGVAGLFDATSYNTLVLFGGANELIHETPTLATLQSSMSSYVSKARAAGYRLFVCTLPTNVRYDAADNALRTSFNDWIKNTLAIQLAGVVDLAAIPEFSDHTNRTYFLADGIHFTAAGYEVVATAVRTATGVTLYEPPVEEPVDQSFTDFSEFPVGNLVAPWAHMPNLAAAESGNLWRFADVAGVRKLRQATMSAVDTGAWTTGPGPATTAIQFYSEGETAFNNNSSMEWLILPGDNMQASDRYRIDYTPASKECRIRKGGGNAYTVRATGNATGSVGTNTRVCCLAEFDGSRVRAKIWGAGSAEPTSWTVSYTDPEPIAAPYYAGVHNYSARSPVTCHLMGVGIDGALAPRAPLTSTPEPEPEPDPEPVEGAQLVANGSFDSNISGWQNRGAGSMSWDSGRLRYAPTSTGQGPYILLNTVAGEDYEVSLDVDYVGGTRGVQVSMSGAGQGELVTDALAPRTITFSFTASSTETELFIRNGGSGTDGVFYVDNVSVIGAGGSGPQSLVNPETNIANLPRVFISTDLKMDSVEKDDAQSLIHALMYQDYYNIVGIAATVSKWGVQDGRVEDVLATLDAYELDQAKLQARSPLFKTAAALRAISYQGATVVAPSAGYAQPTASSQAIIAAANDAIAAGTVLNVLCWGGETDAAQAFHDAPSIVPHVRLFTINKQDDYAFNYIMASFRDTLDMWVDDQYTYGGVWRTNNGSQLIQGFHDAHAQGHGALGDLFYQMSFDLHGENGVKMGDSPTVFRFLRGNQDDPTATGSWGGRFRNVSGAAATYYTDLSGTETARDTIFIHRQAWLTDFQARFDWLLP